MNQNQPCSKPEDADVALELALEAARVAEVAEDRGAAVRFVLALPAVSGREHRVAAAGIDQVTGTPLARRAVFHHRRCRHAVGIEVDLGHAAVLERLCAAGGRVAEQDLVEHRAADLPRVGHRLVPRVGELQEAGMRVRGRHELDPPFAHADALELAAQPEFVEQPHVGWQQRLADVKPRVAPLLCEHHLAALARQQCGRGRAGRAAAHHQHVALLCDGDCHRAHATFGLRAVYS